MAHKPTEQQAAITAASVDLRNGEVMKVIAGAGAGKTSTLKLCAEANRRRGIYLAFNKEIATEAKEKLKSTKCTAMSMHGLAYTALGREIIGTPSNLTARSFIQAGVMDAHHVPSVKGWGPYRIAAAVLRTMSAFAASADTEFLPSHARDGLIESMGDPELIVCKEKAAAVLDAIEKLSQPLAEMAEDYWVRCMNEDSYSHDMYLKLLDLDAGLRKTAFARYKYVMIDEAQDLNPVQRSILEKAGLPLIAVGDPYQQIYSWRGAENALELLPGKEYLLSQSFRFGDNIASIARQVLASIPDGGPSYRLEGVGPGTHDGGPKGAVLCRTNMGMLDEAIYYINKGHQVFVDNIDGLVKEARSAQALFEGRLDDVTVTELKQFDDFSEMEIAAEEGGDPGLSKLVQLVKTKRIGDVERLAANQTSKSSEAKIAVYTAHRSKGLEFPAVQLGKDWPEISAMERRFKMAESQSANHVTLAREAYNTLYVAVTRAMFRIKGHGRIFELTSAPQPTGAMTQEEAAENYRSAAPY